MTFEHSEDQMGRIFIFMLGFSTAWALGSVFAHFLPAPDMIGMSICIGWAVAIWSFAIGAAARGIHQ